MFHVFLFFLTLLSCGYAYTTLSDETLKTIPEPGTDFNIKDGALLAPILRPRVPGTPGSTAVLNHFVEFFRTSLPEWRLEFQNSTSKTPATGNELIPFVNLIATRDPPWAPPGDVGRLALVAHYDSKLTPTGFIGATDSAAPCAMLMHAARSIDAALTERWEKMEAEGIGSEGYSGVQGHKGVQILLLDGEEAFMTWTHTDSLYGARSLAAEWEQTPNAAMSTFHNPISSISLFLLLDLLGAKNPTIPSYFRTTHWAYRAMGKLEQRLRALGQFKSSPNHPIKKKKRKAKEDAKKQSNNAKKTALKPRKEPQFLSESNNADTRTRGFVEDDHIPFMLRGVEILHMIPTPFPAVWHTMNDDGEHLDIDTVEDWAKLVTAFTAEWMDLEGFMHTSSATKRRAGEEYAQSDKKKRKSSPDEKSEL
ncbi:hypothetical protein NA57DRAFT_63555 [Rhizodiscina lignyota]|uniref:Peptide hydrolase n=1 Tax=Rhizodiscina lignyota TaxID=1504668 RepID=A0A9P4IQL0_9PEZI|nr:hypothetical protein NA57DRAFT_63555 [Rhizodiscina lignyota]